MRILYVLPEYPPHFGGGISTFYEALLPEMVRQGHAVDVLVGSAMTSGEASYDRGGIKASFLESSRFESALERFAQYDALPGLQRQLAAAWAMYEQIHGGADYDVVEVVDWGLLFSPWVIDAQVPVVVQLHGSSGQIDLRDPSPGGALEGHVVRLLEAALLRGASCLHTHSRSNQAEWEAATDRSVHYSPPPLVPASQFTTARDRTDRGLVVGRVQKWKGPDVLCEAVRGLGEGAPEIDWVGRDTPLGATGSSMAGFLLNRYPDIWGKRVRHQGQQSPERIAEMQASAGFVVVPSTWDMFNLTAAEAMRAGAVVVCSRGAGASDLIEDGINGLTFPAEDAAELAARLEEVVSMSPTRRAEIGAAARETVERELRPDVIAASKVEAYRRAIVGETPVVDPWAAAAARPSSTATVRRAFLDQQPLADLLSYSFRRLGGRLAGPVRSAVLPR